MREITKARWKRFGYFWLGIVPFIAYFALNMGMSMMLAIVSVVKGMAVEGISEMEDLIWYAMSHMMDYAMQASAIMAVVALIGLGLWYYFGCKRKELAPPKGVLTPVTIPTVLVLALAFQFVVSLLMGLLSVLMPGAMDNYMDLMEISGLNEVTVWVILYGVILGPMAEELVFRGLTMYYMEKVFKYFWIANFIQAVLFGVMHGNLIQGIYAAVLGILMGWLYHTYRSLYITMGFHIAFNLYGIVVLPWLSEFLPENVLVYGVVYLASFVISAICIIILFRHRRKQSTVWEEW